MATEYGLYATAAKEFVWLGKLRHNAAGEPVGFQLRADVIAEFVARHARAGGPLEVHADSGNLPDEDGGWVRVAQWWSPKLGVMPPDAGG